MNKILVGIALIAAVATGVFLIARPAPSETADVLPTSATLSASESFFDFGTISMARGIVKNEFKIRNNADTAQMIRRIFTSCMCTEASYKNGAVMRGPFGMPGHGAIPTINEALEPGTEATIEVVFDPAAHGPAGVGKVNRVVTVETASGEALQLSFQATVTP